MGAVGNITYTRCSCNKLRIYLKIIGQSKSWKIHDKEISRIACQLELIVVLIAD